MDSHGAGDETWFGACTSSHVAAPLPQISNTPADDPKKVLHMFDEIDGQEALRQKNLAALASRQKAMDHLPEGWRKVPSNSRPGQFVFENIYTEERIGWVPTEPAKKKG